MEKIESDHRLREICGTDGLIYNDFAGPNQTNSSKAFHVHCRPT